MSTTRRIMNYDRRLTIVQCMLSNVTKHFAPPFEGIVRKKSLSLYCGKCGKDTENNESALICLKAYLNRNYTSG